MRRVAIAIALAAIMGTGCATTERSYQTSATVTPAGQPHQYTVEFRITEVGREKVLNAPRVTVNAGQEGQIRVCDEKEDNGVFCTALVTETESGLEALTTVTVKADGKETLSSSQTTIIKK